MKAALSSKNQLIPDNDLWIAALATQHGLMLVTRDSHFQSIPGIVLESI
jgi:tRNA(fMet)-specific endonuclease VapC